MGAVADLARNLDLEVVAEGIETPETAGLLTELGCELGQGHCFALSIAPDLLPAVGSPRGRVARRRGSAGDRRANGQSGGPLGPCAVRLRISGRCVRWKFWNDRHGVGPRWPW